MVTCRPAPPVSSATRPTAWLSRSRVRKMPPSTSALPLLLYHYLDKVAREVYLSAYVCPRCHCQGPPPFRPSLYRRRSISRRLSTASFWRRCAHSWQPRYFPPLTAAEHHILQQLGGVLLYYCLAINSTGLPAVTAIKSALSHATQLTQCRWSSSRLFSELSRQYISVEGMWHALHTQSDAYYYGTALGVALSSVGSLTLVMPTKQ